MKRTGAISLLLFFTLAMTACETSESEEFAWLLALQSVLPGAIQADTDAPAEEGTAPGDDTPFEVDIDITEGDEDFIFNTTRTVKFLVRVLYTNGDPAQGATVDIFEETSGQSYSKALRFTAVTPQNGDVKGSFTIDETQPVITVQAEYQGKTHEFQIDVRGVSEFSVSVIVSGVKGPVVQPAEPDQDNDGVPDASDDYPLDPERVASVAYPANGGYYTILYEDLYPRQGDADFNDYAARARFEEDLNSDGKVVRLRGEIVHIAKGAGYNHTLHMALPLSQAHLELIRRDYDEAQTIELDEERVLAGDGRIDFEVMPSSNMTIPQSNTAMNQSELRPGKSAEFELIFPTAVTREELGPPPYDLYLQVQNTGHDIHFPRRSYDENGEDRYVDPNGFPWALLIPGDFAWPYERGDMHNAYPDFEEWYRSGGERQADWYTRPAAGRVFPVGG